MRTVAIYVLLDSDDVRRYVGKAKDPVACDP